MKYFLAIMLIVIILFLVSDLCYSKSDFSTGFFRSASLKYVKKQTKYLERIAIALEKIAEKKEQKWENGKTPSGIKFKYQEQK